MSQPLYNLQTQGDLGSRTNQGDHGSQELRVVFFMLKFQ